VEVRRLTPDDWRLLRSVRLAALEEAPYAFRTTHAEALAYDEERWRRQAGDRTLEGEHPIATFVAVRDDGTGAGMIAGIDRGDCTLVVAMWVAPEHRGTGVFDRLLGAVVAWSPHERVELDVAVGNDRARRAYERHGFVVGGEAADGCEIHMVRG